MKVTEAYLTGKRLVVITEPSTVIGCVKEILKVKIIK